MNRRTAWQISVRTTGKVQRWPTSVADVMMGTRGYGSGSSSPDYVGGYCL